MIKRILYILIICLFVSTSWSATYNWYFDVDATDDSGAGTQGDPWKTLAKLQTQLDTLGGSDIAYVYLERGDTWTITHTGTPNDTIQVDSGTVTIDAYGNGNRPVLDAQETFASDPIGGSKGNDDSIISLETDGNTVKNIEIKNHYAHAIRLDDADDNLIQNCYLHNLGLGGVFSRALAGLSYTGNIIEYCEVSYAMRLIEFAWYGGYAGGINIASRNVEEYGNTARYNYVHHVYGEGIFLDGGRSTPPSIIEYNILHYIRYPSINGPANGKEGDDGAGIVRYNLIWDGVDSTYDGGGGMWLGDEKALGSNANTNWHVYGNIFIGLNYGMWLVVNLQDWDGDVKIYNNVCIDCTAMFKLSDFSSDFDNCDIRIYNNSSIKYDIAGTHINETTAIDYSGFTINNNHFYGGTIPSTSPWNAGIKSGDPKLPKTSGWSTLAAMPSFFSDLYPPSDSGLIETGVDPGGSYYNEFLVYGTGWNVDPNSSVWVIDAQSTTWSVGAIVRGAPIPIGTKTQGIIPEGVIF